MKFCKAGLKFCEVDVLQKNTHCDIGYDVTTTTYSFPDLYLPKIKNASFVAPESHKLSCASAVKCPYLLIPTDKKQITNIPFEWRGTGAHFVAMEMLQWT